MVVLPANNVEMLNQRDLESYQSEEYTFEVAYADTRLKELNTAEDVAEVTPLVLTKIREAEAHGYAAVVVYAFGDVGIAEAKAAGIKIPVIGLGKPAIHQAYDSAAYFTVIPSLIAHTPFIESLIATERLSDKFKFSKHAIGLSPSELRGPNHIVMPRILEAAKKVIDETGAEALTVGCGSFIGRGKILEEDLRSLGYRALVIEPAKAAFEHVKRLTKPVSALPIKDIGDTSTETSFECAKD